MPIAKGRVLKHKNVEENVWELALERTRHVYDLFDHIAVSFSGGKDSTVILNVALEVARERDRLPLHVFYFDEEAIPYEVEDYMRRVASLPDVRLEWYCVPLKHRNGCSKKSPYWYTWAPEEEHLWVRPMPPEAIREIPGYDASPGKRKTLPALSDLLLPLERYGQVGNLLGIRADESLTRRMGVSRKVHDNYLIKNRSGYTGAGRLLGDGNVWKAYPIYDWRTSDVWTAPHKFGWDYCSAYDLWEMAGISHYNQRLAPPYGEEPGQSLWKYQICHPELWEKMIYRVPGAATAARYSQTVLYEFGKRSMKPVGISWRDYIISRIQKFDKKSQQLIADRLKGEIRRHYAKTNEPILPTVPHPITGVSWQWILMIAERGDFKKRKKPEALAKAYDNRPEVLRQMYDAEFLVWEAEQATQLSEGGTRY